MERLPEKSEGLGNVAQRLIGTTTFVTELEPAFLPHNRSKIFCAHQSLVGVIPLYEIQAVTTVPLHRWDSGRMLCLGSAWLAQE